MDARQLKDVIQADIINEYQNRGLRVDHNQREEDLTCAFHKKLSDMVAIHETYIQQQTGSLNTIKWILGLIGFLQVILLFKAFLK